MVNCQNGEMMLQRLDADQCVFLIIDLQERVLPVQFESDRVASNIARFIRGANYFKIPVFIIEQNPDKLGNTPSLVVEQAKEPIYIEKNTISCLKNNEFLELLTGMGRKQLILSGSETQICVQKTALDAMDAGYEVFVLGDGVTSRTEKNIDMGLNRVAQAGGVIESTEGALFEFVLKSDDADFKQVLKIIK